MACNSQGQEESLQEVRCSLEEDKSVGAETSISTQQTGPDPKGEEPTNPNTELQPDTEVDIFISTFS